MRTPLEAVSAQLAAYNARDLEAFVACYAEDVKLWREHGVPSCMGHEDLREHYGPYFALNPRLNALLRGRLVGGACTVIDHEWVTGRSDGFDVEVFATFEVREGLITQVWFRQELRVAAALSAGESLRNCR
jgi:hypothetical protein